MKKIIIAFAALSVASSSFAFAPPTLVGPPRMGAAVQGVIAKKLGNAGYVETDATFQKMFTTISNNMGGAGGIAGTVAGGLVVAGTSPSWGAIALSTVVAMGVGAVVEWGVGLANRWIFGDSGVIIGTDGHINPVTAGSTVYCITGTCSTSPTTTALAYVRGLADPNFPSPRINGRCTTDRCWIESPLPDGTISPFGDVAGWMTQQTYEGPDCAIGFYSSLGCGQFADGVAHDPATVKPPGETTRPLGDVVLGMATSTDTTPVSNKVIAELANDQWRRAAETDPAVPPYTLDDPITEQDVEQWKLAHPASVPTIADLFAPSSSTDSAKALLPAPPSATGAPQTDPSAPSDPASSPSLDLGEDPNIDFTIDAGPDASSVFKPLFDIRDRWKGIVNTNHSPGVCPTMTIDFFGRQVVMNSHCTLFEEIRPYFQASMMLTWTLVAIFVILGA